MARDGIDLTSIELDHVLLAVADLGSAAHWFEAEHGLESVDGGRHPGWGTANCIVPLGGAYLELITIVDDTEAAESPFGRWVAGAELDRPLGWAVRTNELDEIAGRRNLVIDAGARVTPSGDELRWRTAGKNEAVAEPSLPFFIEWAAGTRHPGLACSASARLERIVIEGDAERLADWLGNQTLPVEVLAGAPRVASIILTGWSGEIVVDRICA